MGLGWQITDRTLIAATRESDLMMNGKKQIVYNQRTHSIAPLAQLDRASGYEPEGREFESLRAHHSFNSLGHPLPGALCLLSENCPQNPNRDKCSSPWRPSRLHSLSPRRGTAESPGEPSECPSRRRLRSAGTSNLPYDQTPASLPPRSCSGRRFYGDRERACESPP